MTDHPPSPPATPPLPQPLVDPPETCDLCGSTDLWWAELQAALSELQRNRQELR